MKMARFTTLNSHPRPKMPFFVAYSHEKERHQSLIIEPHLARHLMQQINDMTEGYEGPGQAIVLCPPLARGALRRMLERVLPRVTVLLCGVIGDCTPRINRSDLSANKCLKLLGRGPIVKRKPGQHASKGVRLQRPKTAYRARHDTRRSVRTLPVKEYCSLPVGYERLSPDASVQLEDLVSCGAIGLLEAFDRFEPSRGIKFDLRRVSHSRSDVRRAAHPRHLYPASPPIGSPR